MIEPLKHILDIYDKKKDTLLLKIDLITFNNNCSD